MTKIDELVSEINNYRMPKIEEYNKLAQSIAKEIMIANPTQDPEEITDQAYSLVTAMLKKSSAAYREWANLIPVPTSMAQKYTQLKEEATENIQETESIIYPNNPRILDPMSTVKPVDNV